MTLSKVDLIATLSITILGISIECPYAECPYASCRSLFVVMLSVVAPSKERRHEEVIQSVTKASSIKLFQSQFYNFHPSLIFASEARAYPSGST